MTKWIKVDKKIKPPVDKPILIWENSDFEFPQIAYWNSKEGFYSHNMDDYSTNTDDLIYYKDVLAYAIITPFEKEIENE